MAIADITLLSGFHALRADLEKVGQLPQSPSVSGSPAKPHQLPCPVTVPSPAADVPL